MLFTTICIINFVNCAWVPRDDLNDGTAKLGQEIWLKIAVILEYWRIWWLRRRDNSRICSTLELGDTHSTWQVYTELGDTHSMWQVYTELGDAPAYHRCIRSWETHTADVRCIRSWETHTADARCIRSWETHTAWLVYTELGGTLHARCILSWKTYCMPGVYWAGSTLHARCILSWETHCMPGVYWAETHCMSGAYGAERLTPAYMRTRFHQSRTKTHKYVLKKKNWPIMSITDFLQC